MKRWLVLFLAGCAAPVAAPDKLPEAEAFRAELADPVRHPYRQGLGIDDEALKADLRAFAAKNHDLLEKHFQETVASLPTGPRPSPSEYGLVAELPKEDVGAMSESSELFWAIDPDAKRYAMRLVWLVVPRAAATNGLAVKDLSKWYGFFTAALPQVKLCEKAPDRLVLDVDYGGADVFLITLSPRPNGWGIDAAEWRQRGRK